MSRERIEEVITLITERPKDGFKWAKKMEKKGYQISSHSLESGMTHHENRCLTIIAEKTKPFKP